jgi:hypothetical protein
VRGASGGPSQEVNRAKLTLQSERRPGLAGAFTVAEVAAWTVTCDAYFDHFTKCPAAAMGDPSLQARVLEHLVGLPKQRATRISAGYGDGQRCQVCGELVQPTDVEYELFFFEEQRSVLMHLRCYGLWEAYRLS